MYSDWFWVFWGETSKLIMGFFEVVFPEYPRIGIAVFAAAAAFFLYYMLRRRYKLAFQMALSVLAFFIILLYAVHLIINLYRITV